ncbi:MAG: tetratricopeptide repeat protein [Kiritimatiellae bacterium]|nr:tetratricopeptide repeat protein [Kiritimatiellia bacterium]
MSAYMRRHNFRSAVRRATGRVALLLALSLAAYPGPARGAVLHPDPIEDGGARVVPAPVVDLDVLSLTSEQEGDGIGLDIGQRRRAERLLAGRAEVTRQNTIARDMLPFLGACDHAVAGGDIQRAIAALETILDALPEHGITLARAAALYLDTRRYADAERALRILVRRWPGVPAHRLHLARALLYERRAAEARRYLVDVVSEDGVGIFARLYLVMQGVPDAGDSARDDVASPLTIPEMARLARWLKGEQARLADALGAEACGRAEQWVLTGGQQFDAGGTAGDRDLAGLASQLSALEAAVGDGRYREALAILRALDAQGVSGPYPDVYRAEVLSHTGQTEQADVLFENTARKYPGWFEGWMEYGFYLLERAKYDEAQVSFQRARALREERPDAIYGLAAALSGAGRLADAWPWLLRLAATHPFHLSHWIEGDEVYNVRIREYSEYPALEKVMSAAAARR